MSTLNILRVTELPAELLPHALYVIKSTEFGLAEMVFTDREANPLKIIDSTVVATMISGSLGRASTIDIVDTIQDRDALEFQNNSMVYVINAAPEGQLPYSALYAYKHQTEQYFLLFKTDGNGDVIDNVLWSQLQGAPESTPEQIDAAVNNSHSHENISVLENISEGDDGQLLYKGEPILTIKVIGDGW